MSELEEIKKLAKQIISTGDNRLKLQLYGLLCALADKAKDKL
ncbi:hypothetical protein [Bartonella sp. DGB1]